MKNPNLPFTQAVNFESWCCVEPGNQNKARILAMLQKTGGKHLVLVKPKNNPNDFLQWIYNAADIDASPVVWARDMGAREDQALVNYFRGRDVWLVDPNVEPARMHRAVFRAAVLRAALARKRYSYFSIQTRFPWNTTPSDSNRIRCSRAFSPVSEIFPPAPTTRCHGNPRPARSAHTTWRAEPGNPAARATAP